VAVKVTSNKEIPELVTTNKDLHIFKELWIKESKQSKRLIKTPLFLELRS